MTAAELAAAVPFVSLNVLQPSFIESMLNDPDAPFARAMRENETYDWAPRTPMRIYFAPGDLQVDPLNARVAIQETMTSLNRLSPPGLPRRSTMSRLAPA